MCPGRASAMVQYDAVPLRAQLRNGVAELISCRKRDLAILAVHFVKQWRFLGAVSSRIELEEKCQIDALGNDLWKIALQAVARQDGRHFEHVAMHDEIAHTWVVVPSAVPQTIVQYDEPRCVLRRHRHARTHHSCGPCLQQVWVVFGDAQDACPSWHPRRQSLPHDETRTAQEPPLQQLLHEESFASAPSPEDVYKRAFFYAFLYL